jgi:hypothetical protein
VKPLGGDEADMVAMPSGLFSTGLQRAANAAPKTKRPAF